MSQTLLPQLFAFVLALVLGLANPTQPAAAQLAERNAPVVAQTPEGKALAAPAVTVIRADLGVRYAPPAAVEPAAPGAVSVPDMTTYIELAITTAFQYGIMIFGALIGVAGIGMGFRLGMGLISWVSNMIGNAFSFR